jgi:DNA replication licensing factor MCM2
MEQQSISVSKAGIICTLQARCAVLAAANPKSGRYLPGRSFQENVQLTEPILSRFDVLLVVKDIIDVEIDERLARFVVDNHVKSHPDYEKTSDNVAENDPDIIDQSLLRKYIMYARENISPRLNQLDQDKLAKVYSALRKESLVSSYLL